MGFRRILAGLALCLSLLLGGAPTAAAGPSAALIVTQLADPDPNYVPLDESGSKARSQEQQAMPALDAAMQEFGRAIGQATLLQQQAIEQRCRTAAPAAETVTDRFAWAASCRYTRH
jgi:hypothetical protein